MNENNSPMNDNISQEPIFYNKYFEVTKQLKVILKIKNYKLFLMLENLEAQKKMMDMMKFLLLKKKDYLEE